MTKFTGEAAVLCPLLKAYTWQGGKHDYHFSVVLKTQAGDKLKRRP